jgi:hypothetical protein
MKMAMKSKVETTWIEAIFTCLRILFLGKGNPTNVSMEVFSGG